MQDILLSTRAPSNPFFSPTRQGVGVFVHMRACLYVCSQVYVCKLFIQSLRAFRQAWNCGAKGELILLLLECTLTPRWSQDGATMEPRGPKMAPRGPKKGRKGPRWPQDGPKMGPRGPKMAQDAPKMALRGSKMAPRWPQDGPERLQDGPKMAPRGPKKPREAPR